MVHGVGTVGGDVHIEARAVAFPADGLDRNSGQREIVRQLVIIHLDVDEITQPLGRDFHFSGRKMLCELFQKTHIALKEQLNVVHAILQNCDALHAHAESEATDFLGIVVHKSVHIGIHHAATQQLNPATGLAVGTATAIAVALAAAENATDLHVRAGFGEGKKRRIKACFHDRAKQSLHGVIKRSLQIAESNIGVYGQAFDLVEDWRVGSVGSVVAMNLAGTDHAYRRLHLFHAANL